MKFSTIICSLAVMTFSCAFSSGAQEEMRYILLRSGKIIEGKPFADQEKTRIELAGGDYFVIPNEKVEKAFRHKRDVCNYKAAITPIQTRAQNGLLQWLVNQKCFDFAKQHLTELKLHSNRLPEFDFQYWADAVQNKKLAKQVSKPLTQHARSNAFFKNNVENHLVLGCAISGCHRNKEDSTYFLSNANSLSKQDKNMNLEKTKEILNKLGKKSFLQKVSQKHGSLRAAMYPTATREYLEIATWVNSLDFRRHTPRITSAKKNPSQIKSIPTIQSYKSKPKQSDASPATYQEVSTAREDEGNFVARDEFDPEIFNRLQRQKTISRPRSLSSIPKPESAPQRLTTKQDK